MLITQQRGEDALLDVRHAWSLLQQVVNHVGLPVWLPGECTATTTILLRQKRTRHGRPALNTPPELIMYLSAFGAIRALHVPAGIH